MKRSNVRGAKGTQGGGGVSDQTRESTPAPVPPEGARQAGESRARWAWTEPAVWSERMLKALEEGVKGGKWFSLMDKVTTRRALLAAWTRVRANGGAAG